MFDKCEKCGRELKCQDDYSTLKPGYWWRWRNKTHKDHYRVFIANLLTSSPALGETDVQYPHPLPKPYKCPKEDSCEGGIDSTCTDGYKGPLCSVCDQGHYKELHQCRKCPSMVWMSAQLSTMSVVFLIIAAVGVWTNKRKNKKGEGEHSFADAFLSKIKIAIGFYQVTYGLLEAFSYIEWPESMQVISKYSEILQLNVLQMAPVHCLFPGMQADAFASLFAIMTINAAIVVFAGVVYGVRKVIISTNRNLEDEEKSQKISQLKESVYRNLFFLLYVTYLSTCSKTATVLPLTCRELCQHEKENLCMKYLKADYSIQCHEPWYNKLVIAAYISATYLLVLPTATFIALWRKRRAILATSDAETSEEPGISNDLIKGLHFLYENYKARSWYWELVEMSRKVIVTSGLILVGQESRSYVGLAWIVAGMYGVLFAWNHPIQDAFENKLMTTSLAVTVFNLGVGAVSKIPAENVPTSTNSYTETAIFNMLVLGANTLVIGLLVCKTILLTLIILEFFWGGGDFISEYQSIRNPQGTHVSFKNHHVLKFKGSAVQKSKRDVSTLPIPRFLNQNEASVERITAS